MPEVGNKCCLNEIRSHFTKMLSSLRIDLYLNQIKVSSLFNKVTLKMQHLIRFLVLLRRKSEEMK